MEDNIFREKSLKRISSPESLNDYVKVSNPGVWVLLIGIIFLLLGFLAWGIFGKIDSSVSSFIVVNNHKAVTYIKEDKVKDITDDSFVLVNEKKYKIDSISDYPIQLNADVKDVFLHIADLKNGDWVYVIGFSIDDIANGTFESKIVTESIKPISLLFE